MKLILEMFLEQVMEVWCHRIECWLLRHSQWDCIRSSLEDRQKQSQWECMCDLFLVIILYRIK